MISEKYCLAIILVTLFTMGNAFAIESIPITISSTMDKIVFDGKWTFFSEWKRSSLTTMSYDDGTEIQLRTAHQDNFIYVFVDAISDTSLDKGTDRAMVCFDINNDKTTAPDSDDYCFVDVLDGKRSFVLQGGSPLGINDYFEKISEPDGFIGISSVSDANDRYTPVPHPGYEFKIPTDFVGRSDIYGFYVNVYDAHTNKFYSWPENTTAENSLHIASPNKWGELISPDKSLPEFPWPSLALLSSVFFAIFLTKFKNLYRHDS
jgi:hypothetical protein